MSKTISAICVTLMTALPAHADGKGVVWEEAEADVKSGKVIWDTPDSDIASGKVIWEEGEADVKPTKGVIVSEEQTEI